jgi:hypothetical protein
MCRKIWCDRYCNTFWVCFLGWGGTKQALTQPIESSCGGSERENPWDRMHTAPCGRPSIPDSWTFRSDQVPRLSSAGTEISSHVLGFGWTSAWCQVRTVPIQGQGSGLQRHRQHAIHQPVRGGAGAWPGRTGGGITGHSTSQWWPCTPPSMLVSQ